MSKSTLAIVAAVSAATGASITALLYSKPQTQTPAPPANSSAATTRITPPTTSRRDIPTPIPVSPVDPAGILQYGFPGPVSSLDHQPSHVSTYNRALRNPHFVAEHITAASLLLNNGSRQHSSFYEDPNVPSLFRAKLRDYYRSGYDRGHQVPAADAKWSQAAMDSTFVLTNMCPQVGGGFNRDYWAHFEEFCRDLTQRYPSVRVATGPLYLPKRDASDNKWRVTYEVIGDPPNVAVPTHFYKVIYGEESTAQPPGSKVALAAFVLPNTEIPNEKSLGDFEVPLEAVERASGLTFADKLPLERRKKLCEEVRCEILVKQFDSTRKGQHQQRKPDSIQRQFR